MSFILAIVGRPNVGKSTLFNRLTRLRQGSGGRAGGGRALVDDQPGVTRDRREGKANLGGLEFTVVDTAGLEEAKAGSLSARMTEQTKQAVKEADAALLVVDAKSGITPADRHFAKAVRAIGTPVILVVNKAEGKAAKHAVAEAHELGLSEPIAVSAEHGEGMAELYEALAPFAESGVRSSEFSSSDSRLETPGSPLTIAIVGRPNVGKSTLMNQMLRRERMLTGPEAGITRDAVTVPYEFQGTSLALVDTAGMRRKANVNEKVEKLAVDDAIHALKFAHVAVLVVDAGAPLEKQDNMIAALVEREGRALVIAVNKWDTVDDKSAYLKAIQKRADIVLPQVKGLPIIPVSAETGYGIPRLLKECVKAHELWNKEIGTGQLNRWLEQALEIHTPPLVDKRRLKIRYMTQKSARPPSFLLFANMTQAPESYLRYLVNALRERFDLPGVPIRIKLRTGKNPYAK